MQLLSSGSSLEGAAVWRGSSNQECERASLSTRKVGRGHFFIIIRNAYSPRLQEARRAASFVHGRSANLVSMAIDQPSPVASPVVPLMTTSG